jgi:hypothetical protein
MDKDKYRPIVGYETRYGISETSEIFSFITNKILKFWTHHDGYKCIKLVNDNGKPIGYYVHILVAKTYLTKTDIMQTQVDHIDGDKLNNDLSNLRFVTGSENIRNAFRNNKNMTCGRRSVQKLDNDHNVLETYESVISAARNNGLHQNDIIRCCRNTDVTAHGYYWAYSQKKEKIEPKSDEIFKKIDVIKGMYIDSYEISSYGRVRNTNTQNFLVQHTSSGYVRFGLYTRDLKRIRCHCHKLVAYFFIKKIDDPKMVVNHIDKNKLNNHVSNLEWVTSSENTTHSMGKKVCKINKDTGQILYTYESGTYAANSIGATKAAISRCCNNKSKTSFGFIWKFLEVIIDEMIDDGYIETTAKELNEYNEGTLISFINNANQLRYGRKLSNIVESGVMIYSKDEQRFTYRLSNIKKVWIKEMNVN